jgi:hypothetical protein
MERLGYGHLFESRPKVSRWWKSVSGRKSVTEAIRDHGVEAFMDALEAR